MALCSSVEMTNGMFKRCRHIRKHTQTHTHTRTTQVQHTCTKLSKQQAEKRAGLLTGPRWIRTQFHNFLFCGGVCIVFFGSKRKKWNKITVRITERQVEVNESTEREEGMRVDDTEIAMHWTHLVTDHITFEPLDCLWNNRRWCYFVNLWKLTGFFYFVNVAVPSNVHRLWIPYLWTLLCFSSAQLPS